MQLDEVSWVGLSQIRRLRKTYESHGRRTIICCSESQGRGSFECSRIRVSARARNCASRVGPHEIDASNRHEARRGVRWLSNPYPNAESADRVSGWCRYSGVSMIISTRAVCDRCGWVLRRNYSRRSLRASPFGERRRPREHAQIRVACRYGLDDDRLRPGSFVRDPIHIERQVIEAVPGCDTTRDACLGADRDVRPIKSDATGGRRGRARLALVVSRSRGYLLPAISEAPRAVVRKTGSFFSEGQPGSFYPLGNKTIDCLIALIATFCMLGDPLYVTLLATFNGSGRSANAAPLRKAPGLRSMSGRSWCQA
jgi:hypothetical protein